MKKLLCITLQEALHLHEYTWQKFAQLQLWIAAGLFTPVWAFINKFIWNDWEFLQWLIMLMTFDMVTGVAKSWINGKAVASDGFRLTVIKFVQYGAFLGVMHVLSNFTIKGEAVQVYSWLTVPAYTFLMGIEAVSFLENIQEMNRKFKLTEFIQRIKDTIKTPSNEN